MVLHVWTIEILPWRNGIPSACCGITWPFLLESHDHPVRSGQWRNLRAFEPDVFHPFAAVCTGEVESAVSFNEHVEAHEQPESVQLRASSMSASWTIRAPLGVRAS